MLRLFSGSFRFFFILRSRGIPDGYHIPQIDVMVHVVAGIRDIMFQDREQDQDRSKGQGCQNYTESGSCETGTFCKMNDDIDIYQKEQAVQTDVDQTETHTVFLCKIAVVACVTEKDLDTFKGSAVQEPSGCQAGEKDQKEKDISEETVGIAGQVVKMVVPDRDTGVDHTHSPVQKAEEKESEHTVGQTAVVEKVAFVPGIDAGEDSSATKARMNMNTTVRRHPRKVMVIVPVRYISP